MKSSSRGTTPASRAGERRSVIFRATQFVTAAPGNTLQGLPALLVLLASVGGIPEGPPTSRPPLGWLSSPLRPQAPTYCRKQCWAGRWDQEGLSLFQQRASSTRLQGR